MRSKRPNFVVYFTVQYSTVQYSTVQYSTEQLGCLTRAVGRREYDVSAAATSRPMRRWRHLTGNLD